MRPQATRLTAQSSADGFCQKVTLSLTLFSAADYGAGTALRTPRPHAAPRLQRQAAGPGSPPGRSLQLEFNNMVLSPPNSSLRL